MPIPDEESNNAEKRLLQKQPVPVEDNGNNDTVFSVAQSKAVKGTEAIGPSQTEDSNLQREPIVLVQTDDDNSPVKKMDGGAKQAGQPSDTTRASQPIQANDADANKIRQVGESPLNISEQQPNRENAPTADKDNKDEAQSEPHTSEDSFKNEPSSAKAIAFYKDGWAMPSIRKLLGLKRKEVLNNILAPYLVLNKAHWVPPSKAIIQTPDDLKKQLPGLADVDYLVVELKGDKLIATPYTGQA